MTATQTRVVDPSASEAETAPQPPLRVGVSMKPLFWVFGPLALILLGVVLTLELSGQDARTDPFISQPVIPSYDRPLATQVPAQVAVAVAVRGDDPRVLLEQLLQIRYDAYCQQDPSLLSSYWNVEYPAVTTYLAKDESRVRFIESCTGAINPATVVITDASPSNGEFLIQADSEFRLDLQYLLVQRADGSWGMGLDNSFSFN